MSALQRGRTLFENVPALGTISAEGAGVAKLIPLGELNQQGYLLTEGTTRVGRERNNDLVVEDPQASRYHCEITVKTKKVHIRDLGSGNGTFVNRVRITESELFPGDELWISPQRMFRLVMDEELEKPIDMAVDVEVQRPSAPPASQPQTSVEGRVAVEPETPTLDAIEKQRNVLAILYQISLRCLMAKNTKEIEELLTNVLKRLAPLDSGFILYQAPEGFRASIVPGERPDQDAVRAISRRGLTLNEPTVVRGPSDLKELGLDGGCVLLTPMVREEHVVGVVVCINSNPDAYPAEVLDIVVQLGNVAAAALAS